MTNNILGYYQYSTVEWEVEDKLNWMHGDHFKKGKLIKMSICRPNEHNVNKPLPVETRKSDGTKDHEGKLKYKIVKHRRSTKCSVHEFAPDQPYMFM